AHQVPATDEVERRRVGWGGVVVEIGESEHVPGLVREGEVRVGDREQPGRLAGGLSDRYAVGRRERLQRIGGQRVALADRRPGGGDDVDDVVAVKVDERVCG